MEVATGSTVDVTFRCDAEPFSLLAYGRLSPNSAISQGSLTNQGDQEWTDIFIRSFNGG
jgi:hypothetical protein